MDEDELQEQDEGDGHQPQVVPPPPSTGPDGGHIGLSRGSASSSNGVAGAQEAKRDAAEANQGGEPKRPKTEVEAPGAAHVEGMDA